MDVSETQTRDGGRVIDLLLLGTGAMMPLPDRWLSSLLVKCEGEMTLFDCGEGTQIVWKRFSWGFRRVGAICLTHMHADHVAGLPGVLYSIAHADRTDPVHVYGPVGTREVVTGLRVIAQELPYPLIVNEVDSGESFALPGGLSARAIAGDHRIPCNAYRLDLSRSREFLAARARRSGIPIDRWSTLQDGKDVCVGGVRFEADDFLGPERQGLSVGFVTDSRPTPAMPAFFSSVDLLVSEGTYGASEDLDKAVDHKHMTFHEAATLAREARADALWLTHFSPAMSDPESFLHEATEVFGETIVGYSGLTTSLAFD